MCSCSRPFPSIPHMINYYTVNRLPIKGAEHVSLRTPVCEQLLWEKSASSCCEKNLRTAVVRKIYEQLLWEKCANSCCEKKQRTAVVRKICEQLLWEKAANEYFSLFDPLRSLRLVDEHYYKFSQRSPIRVGLYHNLLKNHWCCGPRNSISD